MKVSVFHCCKRKVRNLPGNTKPQPFFLATSYMNTVVLLISLVEKNTKSSTNTVSFQVSNAALTANTDRWMCHETLTVILF